MSDQATQAANSTEPKYTIEYFMAQGMSRVQAIKAVYVANAKSKRRSSIPTDIPAENLVRKEVSRLNSSKLNEPELLDYETARGTIERRGLDRTISGFVIDEESEEVYSPPKNVHAAIMEAQTQAQLDGTTIEKKPPQLNNTNQEEDASVRRQKQESANVPRVNSKLQNLVPMSRLHSGLFRTVSELQQSYYHNNNDSNDLNQYPQVNDEYYDEEDDVSNESSAVAKNDQRPQVLDKTEQVTSQQTVKIASIKLPNPKLLSGDRKKDVPWLMTDFNLSEQQAHDYCNEVYFVREKEKQLKELREQQLMEEQQKLQQLQDREMQLLEQRKQLREQQLQEEQLKLQKIRDQEMQLLQQQQLLREQQLQQQQLLQEQQAQLYLQQQQMASMQDDDMRSVRSSYQNASISNKHLSNKHGSGGSVHQMYPSDDYSEEQSVYTASNGGRPKLQRRRSSIKLEDCAQGLTTELMLSPSKLDDKEALKVALLISQQEAKFGVNMYDSLLPNDDEQIEEYIAQGLSLEDAILLIFEHRFGKVQISIDEEEVDKSPRIFNMREEESARMSGRRTSSSHTAQGQDLEVDLDAANQLEIEIELLMAAGYSRDAAIKILLEKKKKQQQSDQSVHGQSTSPRFRSSSGGSIVAPNQTQHNQRLSSGGSVAFNNSNSRSSHAVAPREEEEVLYYEEDHEPAMQSSSAKNLLRKQSMDSINSSHELTLSNSHSVPLNPGMSVQVNHAFPRQTASSAGGNAITGNSTPVSTGSAADKRIGSLYSQGNINTTGSHVGRGNSPSHLHPSAAASPTFSARQPPHRLGASMSMYNLHSNHDFSPTNQLHEHGQQSPYNQHNQHPQHGQHNQHPQHGQHRSLVNTSNNLHSQSFYSTRVVHENNFHPPPALPQHIQPIHIQHNQIPENLPISAENNHSMIGRYVGSDTIQDDEISALSMSTAGHSHHHQNNHHSFQQQVQHQQSFAGNQGFQHNLAPRSSSFYGGTHPATSTFQHNQHNQQHPSQLQQTPNNPGIANIVRRDSQNFNHPNTYNSQLASPTHLNSVKAPSPAGQTANSRSRLSSLPPDERALQVALMLSEQEAKFRTNMFESLSPADAPMMDNLLQQGYHEDEAALIIFENKFPQVQNTHANNNRIAPSNTVVASPNHRNSFNNSNNNNLPPRPQSTAAQNLSRSDSMEEMQRIMELSRIESQHRPGAVKVPGVNSPSTPQHTNNSNNNNNNNLRMMNPGSADCSDIPMEKLLMLENMGFSRTQAAHALRSNRLDVNAAAEFLLSNC